MAPSGVEQGAGGREQGAGGKGARCREHGAADADSATPARYSCPLLPAPCSHPSLHRRGVALQLTPFTFVPTHLPTGAAWPNASNPRTNNRNCRSTATARRPSRAPRPRPRANLLKLLVTGRLRAEVEPVAGMTEGKSPRAIPTTRPWRNTTAP